MSERALKRVRCAIYTRKSSEEGLEQAFNSLHAQREACEAYAKSQQHEGWSVLPAIYDDGGFSGGSMERPALTRLLDDVRGGKLDVVVVYKIDRLTRSLFDFAKIVEIFDAASVSFVSITQSFNTTTSMGRLTLNVLLSFAQFEREVTGERIRDKIAASRRKGMFMGGNVPLGYDLADHSLVINDEEAATVRTIFDLYLSLGTVRRVWAELGRLGLRTKRRNSKTEDRPQRSTGGQSFGIGHLYYLLKNPIYVGSVRHKDTVHPGRHEAIIPMDVWDAVQARLAGQAVEREGRTRSSLSILVGRVFDVSGARLTPTHAVKGCRRYRYYATTDGRRPELRLPAADLENAVVEAIASWLNDFGNSAALARDAGRSVECFERAKELAQRLAVHGGEEATPLHRLVQRVTFGQDKLVVCLDRPHLEDALGIQQRDRAEIDPIVIEQSCSLAKRGKVRWLVIGSGTPAPYANIGLVKAIVRARRWFEKLRDRQVTSIADLALLENLPRAWISQQLPLAFLAPDLIEAIAAGRQPASLTVKRLVSVANGSSDWAAQRSALA